MGGGSQTVFGEGFYGMLSPPLRFPHPFVLDAAFLLTVGSFLLTLELFLLTVDNFGFFTYNWSFFTYNLSFFLQFELFAYSGKVRLSALKGL